MLLIDADFTGYKSAQANEYEFDFGHDVIIAQSNFSEVVKMFEREIKKLTKDMMDDNVILYFSSSENFRKKFTPITRVIEIAGSPWDTNVWSTGARKLQHRDPPWS